MGTDIEWADETWNPILGCTKVSPGCDHCYAIVQARIRAGNPHPKIAKAFAGLTENTPHGIDWTGKVNLLPERLEQPFHWRKPRKVFVNSLADLFHKNVPTAFIADVFAVMACTPQHTYQLLTKQQARMRALLNSAEFAAMVNRAYCCLPSDIPAIRGYQWPLRNLWLGVSVENQQWADIRIPALLETRAAVRFLSCEPLLGPVDLTRIPGTTHTGEPATRSALTGWGINHGLDGVRYISRGGARVGWVIAGGESGPGARPMVPDWVRTIRDDCAAAGVPFLFKQWGAWAPTGALGIGGHDPRRGFVGAPKDEHGWREEIARVGKKAAGRVLDGRTWDEFPAATEPVPA